MATIGSSRARRTRCVLSLRLSTFVVALLLMILLYLRMYLLPGIGVPDVEIINGRTVSRRHPEMLYKIFNDTRLPTTPFDGVMEGHLTLVDILLPTGGLHVSLDSPDQIYHDVKGIFCHISWDLQKDNPAQYPTFHDLRKHSFLCPGTIMEADLWDIARKAESYDFRNHTFAATRRRDSQVSVPPTAVVFHESKCGSTIISNALAAFAPRHTRVYAEAPTVTKAILACRSSSIGTLCDPESHQKLIQDVFYILGRVSRPLLPQYVFYKVDSLAVQSIEAFVQAMPQTPWLFVYRDSTEVMMGHFPHYQLRQNSPINFRPICLEFYGHPKEQQPLLLLHMVEAAHRTVDSLTREEYCAVFVATLARSAIQQHNRKNHQLGGSAAFQPSDADGAHHPLHVGPMHKPDQTPHWFVNYNELPYKIWETVLPNLIVGVLDHAEISRIHDAARVYSHARNKDGEHFMEDSTLKQGRAPPSVLNAVQLFLDPVYNELESIRSGQH